MRANKTEFSYQFLRVMTNYYYSLEGEEKKSILEIAKEVEYSPRQVRNFVDSVDSTKDVKGNFQKLYKLVLLHTTFAKNNIEGTHYMNQQEYLEKRARAREITQMLMEKLKLEKEDNSFFC